MTSSFKIPKTKQLAGSDLSHMHMQSPLSRLETSTPDLMFGSINVKTDRRHSGNTFGSSSNKQSAQCKPFFRNVVRNLLGLNSLNRGASTDNHRTAAGLSQRAESSTCFSNGWRPKRASDRLVPPEVTSEPLSPPQKKKSELRASPPSAKGISVESLDPLAELRSVEHAGSLSSLRCAPVEAKQQQKNSSAPGSDQTSEDHFVPPSRIKNKPSTGKSCVRDVSCPSSMHNGRAWLAASGNLRDDLREKQRQSWREFREKKTSYRSAVLHHRPSKPKQTPSEPIVLSSEEDDEDEGDGRKCEISSRVEESRNTEHIQGQQASSSKGRTDKNNAQPPSFLQLEFILLHAGLTQAEGNGKMLITENGISIPLKGTAEGEVIVVASQIQGYGVWDGGVAQGGSLFAGCKGPAPSLLFLWVTDAQAASLQMELTAIQTSVTASGLSCSFILVVLKEQLQELQAALLASIMDTEEYRKGYSSCSGPASPLEWTDGVLLLHSCPPPLDQHLLTLLGCTGEKMRNNQRKGTSSDPQDLQQLPTRLVQYPAPPSKGRITVTKEDLACLDAGKFLNDVIIDFYLKYLLLEGVGGLVTERSHVFSSFFYKQLSRRRAAGENDAPSILDRHMRHQRVKTWTRHVDIFTKDFLFVPVNQESHWFLIVVCFPGLEDVRYEAFRCPTGARCPTGGSERAAGRTSSTPRSLQTPECLQQGCDRNSVLKRPCILVMDSLKLSYHENVCKLLRDYLQVEWEVRRGTPRLFTPDKMRSYNCRVPQQDNSSDCGLYLLQYAESFLQNPVVHFALPVRLDNWFPRQQVRQKREEIRSLIMRMHQSQKK